MQPDDIEPLEPGHWLLRLGQLAPRPLDDEDQLERVLRHAYHLVQLAPRPLRHVIRATCGEAEFEHLLEGRRFEDAVRRLIGRHMAYGLDLSRRSSGVTAEVWYSDRCERHDAQERSAPAALLRAWLRCNAALGREESVVSIGARRPMEAQGMFTEH